MRSKSSEKWLKNHFADPFVIKAKQQGFRSRASYKLMELNDKYKILASGMVVVELGASPGGWTQIIQDKIKLGKAKKSRLIALDILPFEEIEGVEFIQGDFTSEEVKERLLETIKETKVDVILCDIAPNMSGVRGADLAKMSYLSECALEQACSILMVGGCLVIKLFHGQGFDDYLRQVRPLFKKLSAKPLRSTKKNSSEVYLVAQGFKRMLNI